MPLVSNATEVSPPACQYWRANPPKLSPRVKLVHLRAAAEVWRYCAESAAYLFADVPATSGFCRWIEELARRAVVTGCGGGNFCPDNLVTRRQMAVFLLKTKYGSSYVPPACAGLFGDVPCPSAPAVNFIEQLYNEQITGGCQASPLLYCPDGTSTRGQMAVFIVKTFGLQ